MRKITLITLMLFTALGYAQVGINTNNPDTSSALDIESTTGGILIPRLTETQRDEILAPAAGLMIYQTDETSGFYFYNGTAWTKIDGVAGAQGPQGDQGPQGIQGATGAPGAGGAQGSQGDQGQQGIQGETGTAGPAGADGADGINGTNGINGAQGPTGNTGSAGPQGIQGETGAAGPIGGVGPAGATGPAGPTGGVGPAGATGPAGAAGPAGPTGNIGSAGVQGSQGIQGETGADGSAGVDGADGAQGLVGPAGSTGPVGNIGSAGVQGSQGIQGETGAAGLAGADGADGADGAQGPSGDDGPIGSKGDQGIQGDTGPAGPQGIQGEVVSANSAVITNSYSINNIEGLNDGDLVFNTSNHKLYIYMDPTMTTTDLYTSFLNNNTTSNTSYSSNTSYIISFEVSKRIELQKITDSDGGNYSSARPYIFEDNNNINDGLGTQIYAYNPYNENPDLILSPNITYRILYIGYGNNYSINTSNINNYDHDSSFFLNLQTHKTSDILTQSIPEAYNLEVTNIIPNFTANNDHSLIFKFSGVINLLQIGTY